MSETTSEVKEYDNAAEVLDIEAAIVQLDIVDDELISSVACDERAESDLATAEVLTRTTLDNWANPTVIGPNNKEIHKRKLASMINKDRCVTSKSMDRKYRVQGVARHGARNGDRDDSSGHLAYRFGEEDSNPNEDLEEAAEFSITEEGLRQPRPAFALKTGPETETTADAWVGALGMFES